MKNGMPFINQLIKSLIVTNKKDPILKLYYNFSDEINNAHILEYLYYNIDKIDTFLYINDKIVNIQPLKESSDKLFFQYIFYLDLLINKNMNVTNFEFSIDIIKNIIEKQIDDSKILKKQIISKIVIDLINSYISINGNLNALKTINIENSQKILNDNCDILRQINFGKKDIINISLEELYIKIINSLFKSKKFEDYEYIYDLIKQINLEYINLTKEMLEKLLQILNSEESFIKEYIISKGDHFLDINKINFYYILLKYILKNSFYIYQIPFLLETKKIIMHSIKENTSLFTDINDKEFKGKIKYIITFLLDSPHYISKYNSKLSFNEIDDLKIENINSIKTQSLISSNNNENNISNIYENSSKENESQLKKTENGLNQPYSNDKEISSNPTDGSYTYVNT